jgi:hypothetical protein
MNKIGGVPKVLIPTSQDFNTLIISCSNSKQFSTFVPPQIPLNTLHHTSKFFSHPAY